MFLGTSKQSVTETMGGIEEGSTIGSTGLEGGMRNSRSCRWGGDEGRHSQKLTEIQKNLAENTHIEWRGGRVDTESVN